MNIIVIAIGNTDMQNISPQLLIISENKFKC